jgi:hypothetical protein
MAVGAGTSGGFAMSTSEGRGSGFPVILSAGLLLLAGAALLLFVVPIVEDPRPRKPIDGGYQTTVWDKWTWERQAGRSRDLYLPERQAEKDAAGGVPPAGSP